MKIFLFNRFNLIFILLIPVLFSCSKEEKLTIVKPEKIKDIFLRDGILGFRNDSVLNNYFSSIGDKDASILKELNKVKVLNNFQSQEDLFKGAITKLHQATSNEEYNLTLEDYKDLLDIHEDSTINLKNGVYSFADILNRKGEFIIGDQIVDYLYLKKVRLSIKNSSIEKNEIPSLVKLGLIKEMVFSKGDNHKLVVQLRSDVIYPVKLTDSYKYNLYLISQQYEKNSFGKWVQSVNVIYNTTILNYKFKINNKQTILANTNLSFTSVNDPFMIVYLAKNLVTDDICDLSIDAATYCDGMTKGNYFFKKFDE